MMVPNGVCPKFHDYRESSVSVRRSQEFRQSAARSVSVSPARHRELRGRCVGIIDGGRKKAKAKSASPRWLPLPHAHEKQYFLIGLIFGTVPSEITAVCVNRRLPWMEWNCGRFPRAKFWTVRLPCTAETFCCFWALRRFRTCSCSF